MSHPTGSVVAALVSTTLVVTVALGWAGWRLLDQERALDEQRARVEAERAGDAVAGGIRGKLAEAGERLSGWVADPSAILPVIDAAVVIGIRADGAEINPAGGLPFLPVDIQPSRASGSFAALETMEFGGDPERARAGYRALVDHDDSGVKAEALLRLGRVQRKLRDFTGALATYQRLTALGAMRAGDLPAELAGLNGQRSTHVAMANGPQAEALAQQIGRGIDAGRWPIARGVAELYREPVADPRPESWRLANALSEVWRDADGHLPARGQRVVTDSVANSSLLVMWRSNGSATAALSASIERFLDVPRSPSIAWQLVDPEGRILHGATTSAPATSVARIIGNSEYPWTLHTWVESSAAAESGRGILLMMMGAMLVFVWAASFFMAKAIRREAAVARLQSDFVAAVSHEFRSPLTAVRQMAEMLDHDRVTSDQRRHQYYKALVAEATRLQRLVETLLDFGRMEAGAARYRFVDLDAASLVREVVGDIAPHARQSGIGIELDGPDTGPRIHADQAALAVALRNLIDNAIKYSPGEPTVRVQWRHDRDRAAICVIDRGVGIPRSEQQAIFAKFVRGRTAVDANIKGTGVGLAVVQRIVAAHGGEIQLDSEPGRGSTFTMLLPTAT